MAILYTYYQNNIDFSFLIVLNLESPQLNLLKIILLAYILKQKHVYRNQGKYKSHSVLLIYKIWNWVMCRKNLQKMRELKTLINTLDIMKNN